MKSIEFSEKCITANDIRITERLMLYHLKGTYQIDGT